MTAISAKHTDRLELLRDADYFATEFVQRLERLAEIEQSGRIHSQLQQSAALVRGLRGMVRHEADSQRHNAKKRRAA